MLMLAANDPECWSLGDMELFGFPVFHVSWNHRCDFNPPTLSVTSE